jgi:hypothetical protein
MVVWLYPMPLSVLYYISILHNQTKLQTKVLTFFKDDKNMSTQKIVYHIDARMILFAIDRYLKL